MPLVNLLGLENHHEFYTWPSCLTVLGDASWLSVLKDSDGDTAEADAAWGCRKNVTAKDKMMLLLRAGE